MRKAVGIVLLALTLYSAGDDSCNQSEGIFFQSPGNLMLTGILNINSGEDCKEPVASGMEQAAAAIWTVSLLNQQNYLPGYRIGLTLFDGCWENEEIKKAFVQALVLENCLKSNATTLGIFTSQDIASILNTLATGLNKSFVEVGAVVDNRSLMKMVVALMRIMSVSTVHRVAADSQEILTEFGRYLANEGICVYDEVTIDDQHAINNEILNPPKGSESEIVSKGSPVIVLITSTKKMEEHFTTLNPELAKITDIIWILASPEVLIDIDAEIFPNNTYIVSPVIPSLEELDSFLKHPEKISDPLNYRDVTKSLFFLTISSTILGMIEPVKRIYNECPVQNETCSQVTDFINNVASERVILEGEKKPVLTKEDVAKVYHQLSLTPDEETFLFDVQSPGKIDDVALFQIFDPNTMEENTKMLIFRERKKRSIVRVGIEDIQNRGIERTTTTEETMQQIESKNVTSMLKQSRKHPCYEALENMPSICGICLNFVKFLSRVAQEKQTVPVKVIVGWRFETWVTINASVVAMGSLCTITVIIFVVSRLCLGDVLEGSPALSFFLLHAILITYLATLPFSFQGVGNSGDWSLSAVICDLRVAGPPLCYSILFSILFSRSLMLAASDQDGGFMSHVNGYLQAIIIFFTCAVQFTISGEYWLFNSFWLSSSSDVTCQSMYESGRLMFLVGYNFFILVLMTGVIPFMIKSKRNYKEGLFFSIAIIVILLLWCAWITIFYMFPDYKDAAVVLGLTGTPTAIILFVFIPRTYLMTTAIVRDRIVNTLPPLGHSEHQFRSTQALYDTLNLSAKMGSPNPNFYSINPTESTPATPKILPGQYYSSEDLKPQTHTPKRAGVSSINLRCDTPENPLSPSKVTRF